MLTRWMPFLLMVLSLCTVWACNTNSGAKPCESHAECQTLSGCGNGVWVCLQGENGGSCYCQALVGCTSNDECTSTPDTPICDVASGRCIAEQPGDQDADQGAEGTDSDILEGGDDPGDQPA